MIRSFAAIAVNGFREARRNRVTSVVAAFAIVLVLFSAFAAEATVATMDRVVVDLGLGAVSLMLTFLAIFLASGLLNREIERRTIFLLVTKPVSRSLFLVARLAGNMLTLAVLLVAMSAVFLLQMALMHVPVEAVQLWTLALLWFELLVLSSVGVTMSTFSTPLVSGLVTTGVFFAGHLSEDIYALGEKSKIPLLRGVAKGAYYLLPNLERLNLRPRATYQVQVSAAELLPHVGYALVYAAALIFLGLMVFNRRDFK